MTFKPGDRVKVVDGTGRVGVILYSTGRLGYEWYVRLDEGYLGPMPFGSRELKPLNDFEIVDWDDKGDRVVDVYLGDKKKFSQFVADAETADVVESEARAMLAWAEYVRKNPEAPK